jgi:general secretion pathway protein N
MAMDKPSSLLTGAPTGQNTDFRSASRWADSTLEVAKWDKIRHAGTRWGWVGAVLGVLLGVTVFAPATWFASWVADSTQQRIILAQAQGTVWRGDAVAVLTGGVGSRDARALPGRLGWQWRLQGWGLKLELTQSCCMTSPLTLSVKPGWKQVHAELLSQATAGNAAAQWPAAWLSGLGAPWNTLQLSGLLRLTTPGMRLQWAKGQLSIDGSAQLLFQDVASRVTPLDRLGSYQLSIIGRGQSTVDFNLLTQDGALQLSGRGQAGPGRVYFSGEATAREAEQGALNNLLNIIGRRSGDRALLSIG